MNQKSPEIKTQRGDLPHQSKVLRHPSSPVPTGRREARSQPLSQERVPLENRGRPPAALRAPRGQTRKGCGSDPPAPSFRPRSPFRGLGPIPSRPERPLVSRADLPSPSGSGLRSPALGQRQEGGQRMRRLSPGEGREAGPYLIAEDAVRLVTAGRHGGTQLGLARRLQAERQQPARSGRL